MDCLEAAHHVLTYVGGSRLEDGVPLEGMPNEAERQFEVAAALVESVLETYPTTSTTDDHPEKQ